MWRLAVWGTVLSVSLWSQTQPEEEVRRVLTGQQRAWNRGDVRGFMAGYEDSTQTTFVGTEMKRGYAQVLQRYLERYPSREKMGVLTFSNLEIRMLGDVYASVLGNWHLDRSAESGGAAGGYFTLLLRKTDKGWKIFLDHTS